MISKERFNSWHQGMAKAWESKAKDVMREMVVRFPSVETIGIVQYTLAMTNMFPQKDGTPDFHAIHREGESTLKKHPVTVGGDKRVATISENRNSARAFAVMLRHAPAFPDDKGTKPIDVQPLAVVSANDDGGAWGWVNLDKHEKDIVGDALLTYGAKIDVWYYCELTIPV